MKVLGSTNGKQIVASVARHDYISFGDGEDRIMADGGQPNIGDSAGYFKSWGKPIWFEIPQNYAELYNDWNLSLNSPRKYGIWSISEVTLLSPTEIPDTTTFEWQANNEIWGTNGIDGKQQTKYVLLKDCDISHLRKISALCKLRNNNKLAKIADFWLEQHSPQ